MTASMMNDPRLVPADNGCIVWTGKKDSHGYAYTRIPGGWRAVHRITYEEVHGPIPLGLVIDHLCRRRDCVNPSHLEAVTSGENTRRGLPGVLRTHCKNGHPLSGDNLHQTPRRRTCRACDRRRHREMKERQQGGRTAAEKFA